VHNQSNTAVPDDNKFEDLGLNDFIMAQRLIAHHCVGHRRDFMSVHTHGLISCGIEDWDMEDEHHSSEVEVSISYAVVIGMAAIESDIMLSDRVSDLIGLMISVLKFLIDDCITGLATHLEEWNTLIVTLSSRVGFLKQELEDR